MAPAEPRPRLSLVVLGTLRVHARVGAGVSRRGVRGLGGPCQTRPARRGCLGMSDGGSSGVARPPRDRGDVVQRKF